jgi:hypothetical protein
MENLTLPESVKISDKVLFQTIDEQGVLLNLANEKYFGLDEMATYIWHLFSEEEETAKVLEKIQAEYKVDEKILKNDLISLINELRELELILTE